MPGLEVAELALRTGANNTAARGLASGQKDAVQGAALASIGGGHGAGLTGLEEGLIVTAIAAIAVGCEAIAEQVKKTHDKRLSFDQEVHVGIGTFRIPNNILERDLTKEESIIKGFIAEANKHSEFVSYLGIQTARLSEDTHADFYSILPYFIMGQTWQPTITDNPLDRQRLATSLFLKVAVPEMMKRIDNSFQRDWGIRVLAESILEGRNYLNQRRAARFIMMAMANLLWNLMHQVNPKTGSAISKEECIERCKNVELFLNILLDERSKPYVQGLDSSENELMYFLSRIELHTKILRQAYVEDQLHRLDFNSMTSDERLLLQGMDSGVFSLIYEYHDVDKYVPDLMAAKSLATEVDSLNKTLALTPGLLEKFTPIPKWIMKTDMINTPPATILDVVIIWSHASSEERDKIVHQLKRSDFLRAHEFVHQLRHFYRKFIEPVETLSEKTIDTLSHKEREAFAINSLHLKVGSSKEHIMGRLTASRFMPLMAMVLEDFQIQVDTTECCDLVASQGNLNCKKYTGRQQLEAILLSAKDGSGYYQWALAPFIDGTTALDELHKYQYRMIQVTRLLENVGKLVEKYRGFLLQKRFQTFLQTCIAKVQEENLILNRNITLAEQSLSHNQKISRTLAVKLEALSSNLTNCLKTCNSSIKDFERVISTPDFTELQRQSLYLIVGDIVNQYKELFDDDSGLADFLNMGEAGPRMEAPYIGAPPRPLEVPNHDAADMLAEMHFDDLLDTIKSEYSKEKDRTSLIYSAGSALHAKLKAAQIAFIETGDQTLFKSTCMRSIDLAKTDLAQYPVWKDILNQILSVIVSVLSYGIANYLTGRSAIGLFATSAALEKRIDSLDSTMSVGV